MGNQESSLASRKNGGYDLNAAVTLFTQVFITYMLKKQKAELEKMKHEDGKHQETIDAQKHVIEEKAAENTKLNKSVNDLQTDLENCAKANQQLLARKEKYKAQAADLNKTLKKEQDELQKRISQLMVEKVALQKSLDRSYKVNDHLVAKHEKELAEKLEEATRETEERIKRVKEENAQLCDLSRLCSVKDVVVYNEVDHAHLNGKILRVKKLEIDDKKCLAEGVHLSFKHAGFKVCVLNELLVKHLDVSTLNERVFYRNITKLCLVDLSLTFDEYKEIVANIPCLSLRRITVKDEHGITIDVADLLEEVPDVESFEYIFKRKESIPTKKIASLSTFPNLKHVHLSEAHEDFDVKEFAEFIHNNPCAYYNVELRCCPKFYAKVENVHKNTVPSTYKLKIMKLK